LLSLTSGVYHHSVLLSVRRAEVLCLVLRVRVSLRWPFLFAPRRRIRYAEDSATSTHPLSLGWGCWCLLTLSGGRISLPCGPWEAIGLLLPLPVHGIGTCHWRYIRDSCVTYTSMVVLWIHFIHTPSRRNK